MQKKNDTLNAILIQYVPEPRNIKTNINTVERLLEKYNKDDEIDVILFPEMALTGYIFDSKEDVEPYLEEFDKGETFDFCSKLAKKFGSYVFCGFPEKEENDGSIKYYNSCLIVNRQGIALKSYKKHFLYEMDKTWCEAGEDFGFLEIETRKGNQVKLGIGICMDLNPWEFKSPWEAMEFSNFCYKKNVDIILFLTNWLDNEPELNTQKEILHILNYWCARLNPFLENKLNKKVFFLAANRCGKERDTNFIGCSCVLELSGKGNSPSLIDNLNKKDQTTIYTQCKLFL
jgi:protein N-terminal amidase